MGLRRCILVPLVLMAAVHVSVAFQLTAESNTILLNPNTMMDPNPVLLNCTTSSIEDFPRDLFTQEQRREGAVFIHFFVIAYMCGVMGVVCHRYFVPSLEIISETCGLSNDVAGATFMAVGTSAPELFTSLIGSFVTEGDIGIGTIVGSAVFNILGVTALIGLSMGKKALKVDWFPLSRDCIVYMISVGLLVLVVLDNYVTWYEAAGLLLCYVVYVTVMLFNSRLEEVAHTGVARLTGLTESKLKSSERTALLGENTCPSDDSRGTDEVDDDDDYDESRPRPIFEIPDGGFVDVLLWLIFLPANIVLALTIPDVHGAYGWLFPVTFIMSVVWIGLSSYVTAWMVTVAGYTFGIPDTIAGLTILAAGTSVPEIFASVLVAKKGHGNMALCNLLGSNIFDILFCLGAPWFAKALIANRPVLIQSPALTYISITLLTTVFVLYMTMIVLKWKVNYKAGLVCLLLYATFITLSCLYEFFVFGFAVMC